MPERQLRIGDLAGGDLLSSNAASHHVSARDGEKRKSGGACQQKAAATGAGKRVFRCRGPARRRETRECSQVEGEIMSRVEPLLGILLETVSNNPLQAW